MFKYTIDGYAIIPFLLGVFLLVLPVFGFAGSNDLNVMPVPSAIHLQEGKYRVSVDFCAGIEESGNAEIGRAHRALRRMLNRLAGRTGLFFKSNEITVKSGELKTDLQIRFKRTGRIKLAEDESYNLAVTPEFVRLKAETDIGIIRGLETLLQLLNADSSGYYFPAVTISDHPRFPWRGLLIDSCRHFFPVQVIKRNLDAMAAVKLNVLHWHLTEDQGFRIECKTFPKLHQLGSDGLYYTHEQVKDIIAYAADRGIRVMPEFDIPGHSTSWLVGYPELASAPGPYSIERGYGVKDPTFDPTQKATYKFFNKFFKEMAALFPDEYFHIGGDENNGKQWNSNKKIQAYKKKHNLKDNHALQAHFNKKILKILTKYRKKMVGWDEIFQPELPKTILIQSWRGREAMQKAAQQGYNSILSNGYYIDLVQPTDFHYLNDPIPGDSNLTADEKARILGGEATMWSELISFETIDSRIWPRTAAIAERLWSPGTVRDIDDMYRRMNIISVQLEELGLAHIKNQDMMLRRLTMGMDIAPLKTLVEIMEPLKGYHRHRQAAYTFYSPLTRLVDAAQPDAPVARRFRKKIDAFLDGKQDEVFYNELAAALTRWKENHPRLKPIIDRSPVLKEIETLSEDLANVSVIGLEALKHIRQGNKPGNEWITQSMAVLEKAKKPRGHAELMIISAVRKMVEDL